MPGATRFPTNVANHLDWAFDGVRDQLYTQYRLLSQYTHSSFLAAASATHEQDGQLVVSRLPQVARMTVLRNAVANMSVITTGCDDGLAFDSDGMASPLALAVMRYAFDVAELLQEFAPATE